MKIMYAFAYAGEAPTRSHNKITLVLTPSVWCRQASRHQGQEENDQ